MSSFRPDNNAKLYASPEDMKHVGYRAQMLSGSVNNSQQQHQQQQQQQQRGQLRKSHSLRTPNGTGPPNGTGNPKQPNGDIKHGGNNQYAQPLKNGRSHSTAGLIRERKKKASSNC